MTQILYGDRLGREGKIRVGCSAAIINNEGKVLLTRRLDNGQWRLPSGGMDAGESPSETCVREVFEETGLRVRVKRLARVYSDPNQLVVYLDGMKILGHHKKRIEDTLAGKAEAVYERASWSGILYEYDVAFR